MNFSCHAAASLAVTTLLLLLAGTAQATQVSMAAGSVTFHTPDNWVDIMETQGDPEARVFQVPDPSPSGKNNLARITVTVTQVPDANGFQQYLSAATAKATLLTGYRASAAPHEPGENLYNARENSTEFSYVEHYWFKHGHAIQLRCVRPTESAAGGQWMAAFDKGCATIASQLK